MDYEKLKASLAYYDAGLCKGVIDDVLRIVLEAARAELARREGERPKRSSLFELETALKVKHDHGGCQCLRSSVPCAMVQEIDLLKKLAEFRGEMMDAGSEAVRAELGYQLYKSLP